ncbi:G-protein-signaling modulator 2-like [Asterias amurensis]|uniref:G-protein-signaling modulator 2-like n=1 Tax=Asterias amurensis TaxID=7602 RepID=UPI003AB84CFA
MSAFMMDASCMELALEGERLCKAGNCKAGVQYFEAAVEVGTDDLRTLSAIYSQLGNAYFYLQDYTRALEYHRHDLTLACTLGDHIGEAKASGNLGNTLKVLGKFDEAIVCCQRHLDISRELGDRVGEGRALYNLGNVYHAKGKHAGRAGHQDPGDFPEEVIACLKKAVEFYEMNLTIVKSLGDKAAQGRACGNLGNTHYLLGNFETAIGFHKERLSIAKEFGDKAAERRAYSNLGNACVFMGDFETAADFYKKTLHIARRLGDVAIEAQACYSLGNTFTLLRDYNTAVEYHERHHRIAQKLKDRVGEGRACWSLGNAHTALQNHDKALHYATLHLQISREVGDKTGELTAQMNLADLRTVLGLDKDPGSQDGLLQSANQKTLKEKEQNRQRRRSMERLELVTMTPDKNAVLGATANGKSKQSMGAKFKRKAANKEKLSRKSSNTSSTSSSSGDSASCIVKTENVNIQVSPAQRASPEIMDDDDSFFDVLSRFQGKRMDEQRCSFNRIQDKQRERENSEDRDYPMKEELMNQIASFQRSRLNEQRSSICNLPGLKTNNEEVLGQLLHKGGQGVPDDDFFDMLMRCQGSRINDQRSEPPVLQPAPTVPDEDFFALIQRVQSKRMDAQRADNGPKEKK